MKMMRHKPMLAHPVSDRPVDYDSGPVFIQPKLDGVRCLIQYDNSTVTAYSRTGKEWKNIDHILFNLKPFFQLNPDVVLDGELYNHKLKHDFEKIISLVRKQKPTEEDRRDAQHLVQFHVYDFFSSSPTINYGKYIVRMKVLADYTNDDGSNFYDSQINMFLHIKYTSMKRH